MSLADEHRRQFGWRDWPAALRALPPLAGATVLDLGCGVGDLAAYFPDLPHALSSWAKSLKPGSG